MVLAMDKCTARVRVRDACGDDVQATIINFVDSSLSYLS